MNGLYFPPQRYKTVLVADNICPSATANTICTATTNNALQGVIDALNSVTNPPDLQTPNVFDLLSNFWSLNLGIINGLTLEPFINLLQPVYDFLTERRCVWFFGEHCFRITDIFDNWLVDLVQGLIDEFLRPLLAPIQDMFRDIMGDLMLPGLPSLSISRPNWGYLNIQNRFGFEFLRFFDRFRLRCPSFRCLTMDANANAVVSDCFDFPSLSISIPFISGPFTFRCDQACDSSCDSSCDWSCDTSCDSSCDTGCNSGCTSSCDGSCDLGCNDSCDDSCDFLGQDCDSSCDAGCDSGCDDGCDGSCNTSCDTGCNSLCDESCNGCDTSCDSSCDSSCDLALNPSPCTTSGRRLTDSSDTITAEPKAIGWSERLAAAANKEGN